MPEQSIQTPLCIDLDGTLLHTDLLLETGLSFVRNYPWQVPTALRWLAGGKAVLKEGLAQRAEIDVSVLPYDPAVLALIRTAKYEGRTVVLATATHALLAERVAAHLDLFDMVLATDSTRNLSATRKRDLLVEHYGEGGFDYVGNSHDDLAVWASARHAYLVNPEYGVLKKARLQVQVADVILSNPAGLNVWLRALRVHQWAKNTLVFVPLIAAHQLGDWQLLCQGLLAFLFFSMCASSVYLLNDLLDLDDDRHHPTKHNRPLAAGRLSVKAGLIAIPLLLLVAFAGAILLLPWHFVAVLAGYYALTLAYSLSLKQLMTVDIIVLAMLYTARIIAGSAAFSLAPTFWLLSFSMFIFLSLALVKRYSELNDARVKGRKSKTRGRGYYPADLFMVASLGASSGYLAVMVLALYIHDQPVAGLYTHPEIIWLACPLLLFWITRVWMLTHRGEMDEDPVLFAIRDRVSQVIGLLFAAVFWIAA